MKKASRLRFGLHFLHQRVPYPEGLHREALEELWLEVEEAVEGVEGLADLGDAPRLPGPHLGAYEVVQPNAWPPLPEFLGQLQVETGVVDAEDRVNVLFLHDLEQLGIEAAQGWVVADYLHETHDAQIPDICQFPVHE